MGYKTEPSPDGKYIIQKPTGEMTRELAVKYILESHALGKKLGIDRYLMDLTEARNADSIFDNYDFAYRDMKETPGINRLARVAVLVSPDDHSHDFIETVVRNSGQDVTMFTDRELAIKHLTQE